MNKNILILSGSTVGALALGAYGGYLFAAKKLGAAFDERLELEIARIREHYKPAPVEESEDIPDELEDDEPSDEEILRQEELEKNGKAALTDYQGLSTRGVIVNDDSKAPLQTSNLFDKAEQEGRIVSKGKKALPPRDDHSGRFVKQKPTSPVDDSQPGPYEITQDDFLQNPFDYENENVRYFRTDDGGTILDYANEVLENNRVGQDNLDKLVERGSGETMCVRNEDLATDYEILMMGESIEEYLGISDPDEIEDDEPDSDRVSSALSDTRRESMR